jgi:hypothetical protein
VSNDIQRRLRRAKDSERRFAKWLVLHDGEPTRFRLGGGIATSTGRVGHVSGLQFDCVSMTYAGENKQMKVWAGLWTFWKQVVDVARREHLEPVLRIEPTNEDKAGYPDLHIITEARHAELLDYERQVKTGMLVRPDPFVEAERAVIQPRGKETLRPVLGYSKGDQTARSPGAAKRRR